MAVVVVGGKIIVCVTCIRAGAFLGRRLENGKLAALTGEQEQQEQ